MYFTYSVIFAVGVSLSFTSNFDIVPKYFKKKISIATGLLASGFGIAFLVMSPILEVLLTHVGWRNTYRTISGLALLMCISAAVYSPHVEKDNPEQQRHGQMVAIDNRRKDSLLRNGRFVVCCLSTGVIFHTGITIPIAHMVGVLQRSLTLGHARFACFCEYSHLTDWRLIISRDGGGHDGGRNK